MKAPGSYELVTPSTTSNAEELEERGLLLEGALMTLENIEYIKARRRGYLLVDVGRDSSKVQFKIAETVYETTSAINVEAEFEFIDGEVIRRDDGSFDGT